MRDEVGSLIITVGILIETKLSPVLIFFFK